MKINYEYLSDNKELLDSLVNEQLIQLKKKSQELADQAALLEKFLDDRNHTCGTVKAVNKIIQGLQID